MRSRLLIVLVVVLSLCWTVSPSGNNHNKVNDVGGNEGRGMTGDDASGGGGEEEEEQGMEWFIHFLILCNLKGSYRGL